MKNKKLINGIYSPADAKEILLNLVENKINFHKLKSLSSFIGRGKEDHEAESMIEDLKAAKEQILQIINKATADSKRLNIEASINITIQEEEHSEKICSTEEVY